MARRPDVSLLSARRGDANGVVDHAGCDFVVAHESGEDGKTGGVGGGPSGGTQGVAGEVEDGSGAGVPVEMAEPLRLPHLIENAVVGINRDYVPVAGAFNRCIVRQRVRTAIALAGVVEVYCRFGLGPARHGDKRNTVG